MTGIGRGVIGIAVAVGLAVGLGGGVPGAGAQGAPPIRVGFSSAMTGPSAITGEGVKWAAQMLADEYNAKGGIAGRKIELYFGDNAGTPGEAVSATRKLVDVDKVDVIVGQTHSGACLGALPVVKELQVPMVIEACSNPKIRDQIGKNGNEWAFRVNPDDVMLANQFAPQPRNRNPPQRPIAQVVFEPKDRIALDRDQIGVTDSRVVAVLYNNVRGSLVSFNQTQGTWLMQRYLGANNAAVTLVSTADKGDDVFFTEETFITPTTLKLGVGATPLARPVKTLPPKFKADPDRYGPYYLRNEVIKK